MNDVERVYGELSAVRDLLRERELVSDIVAFEELGAKTILLCAASYFERQICSMLLSVAAATGSKRMFCTFIEKQALERKYHSLFDWDRANANKFFGLFGPAVSAWLRQQVKDDPLIEASVREFIFVNARRNVLVHGNFAAAGTEVTFDEAWQKYLDALKFVEWLPKKLAEASAGVNSSEVTN